MGLSLLCGVLVAGLALPAIGLAGVSAQRAAESFSALPGVLQAPVLPQRSRIVAADGTPIATFYRQNRIYVPLAKIAPSMREAIVAVEDARFYQHNGIDVQGTLRALVINSRSGSVTQGGSTLTQQYVKNVLQLTAQTKEEREAATAQTLSRKIREMRLALGLEQQWSKDQILEGYLNIAYFGAGAYGVEAAARRYFSTNADNLTLAQAATLAGLVQNPSVYDPLTAPRTSRERRSFVLDRMAAEKMISPKQQARAQRVPTKDLLRPNVTANGCANSWAPFYCDYVEQMFLDDPQFGPTRADRRQLLYGGGVTIRTTLAPQAQRSAQRAVEARVPPGEDAGKIAAVTLVQPGTGDVVAMAQNRRYGNGPQATFVNYNVDAALHGSQEGAAAGSTFKAFTLAAAIDKGLPLSTTLYAPQSKVYPEGTFTDCEGNGLGPAWQVTNSTTTTGGTYNMYTGTAQSVNSFFSELELKIGVCSAVEMARRLGVRQTDGSEVAMNPSFTLGTDEVSPLTMASAYATFAARGTSCKPRAITRVTSREGTVVARGRPECRQVLDPPVADAVNSLLAGVIDGRNPYRTGADMTLGRPAAGKTGTIDSNAAVWFVGYTPDLAGAATVFDPRGPFEYPLRNIVIGGTYYDVVYGKSIPGPIWKQTMLGALRGTPPTPFVPVDPYAITGRQVPVPYLAGLTPDAALLALRKVGLQGTVSAAAVGSAQPQGTVAYTSPTAGVPTIAGTTVTVFLSNGVAPVPAPSPSSSSPRPSASPSGQGDGNGDGTPGQGDGNGNGNGGGNGNGNGDG